MLNNKSKKGRKPMAKLLNKNDIDNNCLIAHLPIKIDNMKNNNNNNNNNTEKLNNKLSLFLNTENNNDNIDEEKNF